MNAPTLALVSLATLGFATTALHAEEKRELGSHEHGHAKMEIAVDGDKMNVELEVPGESIVGFEYAAKTDEEKAKVEAAVAKLSDATAVFSFPEAAGCAADKADAELHQDGDHNAFEVAYTFTCANMAELKTIDTKLFALYPSIEEIDVDYATPAGQGSAELEADAPTIGLAPAS